MTIRTTTLFLCPPSHRLFNDAMAIVQRDFSDVRHVSTKEQLAEIAATEIVISFLSAVIVPERLLRGETVNFHPAPPDYPGRGSASIAIYENAPEYGATAHRMAEKVDTGEIVLTRLFPIGPQDGCALLFDRAEDACLQLFEQCATHFVAHGCFPPPNGESWTRKAMTRKQFEQWLILDPAVPEDMERKIRAARHPRFPGPYLIVNGHRFSLHERAP